MKAREDPGEPGCPVSLRLRQSHDLRYPGASSHLVEASVATVGIRIATIPGIARGQGCSGRGGWCLPGRRISAAVPGGGRVRFRRAAGCADGVLEYPVRGCAAGAELPCPTRVSGTSGPVLRRLHGPARRVRVVAGARPAPDARLLSPRVRSFSAQPFWLLWGSGGKTRRHAPDFFVRLAGGGGVVVDVRADDPIAPEDAEAFEVTAAACELVGWGYRLVGVLDPVLAANVRWLAGYRHPRCLRAEHRAGLLEVFTRPAPLLAGAEAVGDRIAVLPSLFHLMWTGALAADLEWCCWMGLPWSAWAGVADHGVTPARAAGRRRGLGRRCCAHDHRPVRMAGFAGRCDRGQSSVAQAESLSAPGFRMVTRAPRCAASAGAAGQPSRGHGGPGALVGAPHRGGNHRCPAGGQAGRKAQARVRSGCVHAAAAGAGQGQRAGRGRARGVAEGMFQRLRLAYEKRGIWGLVDRRAAGRPGARTDERVLQAIGQAVAEETNRSTGTVTRRRRRVEQILASQHGIDPSSVMPARATSTAWPGRSRRASTPSDRPAPAGRWPTSPHWAVRHGHRGAPGRVDAGRLHAAGRAGGTGQRPGRPGSAELDHRPGHAEHPGGGAAPGDQGGGRGAAAGPVDDPQPMRPGWPDALRMSRSVLPHRLVMHTDQRLEHAAARPVIVPETIVCDHGMVYMSQAFRSACRAMGISVQPSHEGSPWEKGTGGDQLFGRGHPVRPACRRRRRQQRGTPR